MTALLTLFEQAVAAKVVTNSECERLHYFTAAEHARASGKMNPCGLFVWPISNSLLGVLAGPCVRPGLHGAYPSLTDLVDGDLKVAVDFRRVYATVLEGWLGLASKEALGGAFEPLPLFHG